MPPCHVKGTWSGTPAPGICPLGPGVALSPPPRPLAGILSTAMVLVILQKPIWMAYMLNTLATFKEINPLLNLALPPRSAGAAGQNILFTGTETNCQIKINSVKNEQSGDWVCR